MAQRYTLNSESEDEYDKLLRDNITSSNFDSSLLQPEKPSNNKEEDIQEQPTALLKTASKVLDHFDYCRPGPSGLQNLKLKRQQSPVSESDRSSCSTKSTSKSKRIKLKVVLDEIPETNAELTNSNALQYEDAGTPSIKETDYESSLKFKRKQQKLVERQQKTLLQHPEMSNSPSTFDKDDYLDANKFYWVQKYFNSMTPDRIDYDKSTLKYEDSIDTNYLRKMSIDDKYKNAHHFRYGGDTPSTILKRLDFQKEQRRISILQNRRSLKNMEKLFNYKFEIDKVNATSTPIVKTDNDDNENHDVSTDVLFDANESVVWDSINGSVPTSSNKVISTHLTSPRKCDLPIENVNLTNLDARFVTLRTPRKSKKNTSKITNNSHSHLASPSNELQVTPFRSRPENLPDPEALIIIDSDDDSLPEISSNTNNEIIEILDDTHFPNSSATNNHTYGSALQSDQNHEDDSVVILEESRREVQLRSRRFNVRRAGRKRIKKRNVTTEVERRNIPATISSASLGTETSDGVRKCAICFEPYGDEISSTICGHVFCTPCIKQCVRIQKKCPQCRLALNMKKIHPLYL